MFVFTCHVVNYIMKAKIIQFNYFSLCRLLPQCMPLCTYDIKMSDLQTLGSACLASIGNVVRCAAGGRGLLNFLLTKINC